MSKEIHEELSNYLGSENDQKKNIYVHMEDKKNTKEISFESLHTSLSIIINPVATANSQHTNYYTYLLKSYSSYTQTVDMYYYHTTIEVIKA